MPKLSEFYGISIHMYRREHGVPHFHAWYSGHKASITIEDGVVLAGSLPNRAMRLVRMWADLHSEELADNWRRARERREPQPIRPLD